MPEQPSRQIDNMVFQSLLTRESSSRSTTVYCDSKCTNALKDGGDNQDTMFLHYPNEEKRVRTRGGVSFDDRRNTIISIPSMEDFTQEEHAAYFYQRTEYIRMKDDIKRTIDLLKRQNYEMGNATAPALMVDHSDHVCVRGLECLADEYVSMHRKRVHHLSTSAVLMQQSLNRTYEQEGESVHCGTERMARAYQVYAEACQAIAQRWGQFDAIDAGMADGLHLCDDVTMTDISTEEILHQQKINPSKQATCNRSSCE